MSAINRVYRFRKIKFDASWVLTNVGPVFIYETRSPRALIEVCYEAPTGELFTQILDVAVTNEKIPAKAFVNIDILHVPADKLSTPKKGDILD